MEAGNWGLEDGNWRLQAGKGTPESENDALETRDWSVSGRPGAHNRTRAHEGHAPLRAGTEGPDRGTAKALSPLRAGRDGGRGPNILIDPRSAVGAPARV